MGVANYLLDLDQLSTHCNSTASVGIFTRFNNP